MCAICVRCMYKANAIHYNTPAIKHKQMFVAPLTWIWMALMMHDTNSIVGLCASQETRYMRENSQFINFRTASQEMNRAKDIHWHTHTTHTSHVAILKRAFPGWPFRHLIGRRCVAWAKTLRGRNIFLIQKRKSNTDAESYIIYITISCYDSRR